MTDAVVDEEGVEDGATTEKRVESSSLGYPAAGSTLVARLLLGRSCGSGSVQWQGHKYQAQLFLLLYLKPSQKQSKF